MRYWIAFLLGAPVCSAAVVWFLIPQSEAIVSKIASLTKLMVVIGAIAIVGLWTWSGSESCEVSMGDLAHIGEYRFPLLFFLDSASVTFLVVIAFLSAIIIRYCRYYLHREEGYARFFMTIFLFITGMNLIVVAGTLELLFAGWEMVGISSFLLIAFYRERTLPVRNAFRAYVVYRICDAGLLLSIPLAHSLWKSDSHLSFLSTLTPQQALAVGYFPLLGFSLLILLASCGKSAQFPFCFWLPRAMEGPTPSSAIFYGALSIHAGVFLLIRTFPVWHALGTVRGIVGGGGIASAFVATLSGRTQSNIKGQLAYASIAQVGIMLVELALGLRHLAVLHLATNAFLKCYELLVSPSVVAQILRIQGTVSGGIRVSDWSLERRLSSRWRSSLYVFALNEGYLEDTLRFLVIKPIGFLGMLCHRFFSRYGWMGIAAALLAIAAIRFFGGMSWVILECVGIGAVVLIASLMALAEKRSADRVWNAVGVSAFLGGLFPIFTDPSHGGSGFIYYGGILPGWLVGKFCLSRLGQATKGGLRLDSFTGLVATQPVYARWLFVAVLAMAVFPITPAFIGEDLLLEYCSGNFAGMALILAAVFVMNGITLIRLYSRICLGPSTERTGTALTTVRALSVIGIPTDPKHWGGAAVPFEARGE